MWTSCTDDAESDVLAIASVEVSDAPAARGARW
jgi:hypothetical protein